MILLTSDAKMAKFIESKSGRVGARGWEEAKWGITNQLAKIFSE